MKKNEKLLESGITKRDLMMSRFECVCVFWEERAHTEREKGSKHVCVRGIQETIHTNRVIACERT